MQWISSEASSSGSNFYKPTAAKIRLRFAYHRLPKYFEAEYVNIVH